MPLLNSESLFAMQPEATTSSSPGPATSGGGGAPAAPGGPDTSFLLMLGMMFVIFYFMLIRPQQKRQREVDDMLKALRKGDKIRTTGGIKGEIVDLNEADVTLLIADKVKINVLRSHVASRIDKPQQAEKADAKAKS